MENVELVSITPNAMELLKRVAGVCYQKEASENVIKKILDMGHWSVFEHCYATFRLKISVACLLQITRHRHLSFTVQSSRFTELKDFYKTGNLDLYNRIKTAMDTYDSMVKGYGPEDAMYCMPKAAMYEVYVTGNFRAWLEYLPKRMCHRAMQEHRVIAMEIKEILKKEYPAIFKNVFPSCLGCQDKKCHVNSFFNGDGKEGENHELEKGWL